jgi:hypothetical protein
VDVGPLRLEVGLVADRLRSMSAERLTRPFPPYASRAEAALNLAQLLADHSADLEGRPRRTLPDLGALVVGDQVAVTGADLAAAACDLQEGDPRGVACLQAVTGFRRSL